MKILDSTVANDAVAEFGKSDYSTGVMVIVVALIIAVVFGVIAAQMVVLLCSSWILSRIRRSGTDGDSSNPRRARGEGYV